MLVSGVQQSDSYVYVPVCSVTQSRHILLFVILWTVACQAPLSMELSQARILEWVARRRKQQPTPVLLPGKFHGERSLTGYSPQGHKESDTTEQLHCVYHITVCVTLVYIPF